jgi:dCMP deaminase
MDLNTNLTEKEARYHSAYLRMAREWAKLSHCKRKKVGALIVNDDQIISDGYNGMPAGLDNCCEDDKGATKWEVLHAEANAILKVADSTNKISGSTLYLTMSPCTDCAKMIVKCDIKQVIYMEEYRDLAGVNFLKECGVKVIHFPIKD